MRIRLLLASAGLLGFCGALHAQQPVPQPVPNPGGSLIPSPGLPVPGNPTFPSPTVPPVPREKSVDDLIAELEHLSAQKAELEKKEQELKTLLRKKVQLQTERLQKLGVAPKPAEPDRVGRIILEGTAENDEKKILDMIGIRPGEVLRYPVLEETRTKLEKAGFREVVVEVVPNKQDAQFKDIRVRVEELKR
ncbi:hypothetical protein J8F10_30920 [Gemmata sp. G18]|uniref:POTRA domain-containing protein n=1 Tax=Gemmata palustris TaxID=2822762 RepID=A0ABS5C142_9BACT|nr:POTRA domain-containing protein [Gemmata palustris]MBP3959681.1 hypothetical protein [Gemmata palustris]